MVLGHVFARIPFIRLISISQPFYCDKTNLNIKFSTFGELIVDLTDDALYILQLLKEYYESENIVSEWLFVNKSGRIHNRAMDLWIRRYCRLAAINEKSLHKVRSTYISLLREAGVSFEKLAEEIGHKSVLTTMLNYSYDTLEDEENKQLINKGLNIHTA